MIVETKIQDVVLFPLQKISSAGGAVLHMMRPTFPVLPGKEGDKILVGEIYFSEVLPGAIKAWKKHSRQTQFFCIPVGRLGIVLVDDRANSPSYGQECHFVLGPDDLYALIRIPCGVLYGFTGLAKTTTLICNAADIPHDPTEGEKRALETVPFDWTASDIWRKV